MKAALLTLLFLTGTIFSENINLPVLWLKSDKESRLAEKYWNAQNFSKAASYYETALASLNKLQSYDEVFHPEMVSSKVTALTERLQLCRQFNQPLDNLSKTQLVELIKQQRLYLAQLTKPAAMPKIQFLEENLPLKVKALQDQVAELKHTLRHVLSTPEKSQLKSLRYILEAETNACMTVAERTLKKVAEFDKESKKLQDTVKGLKLKNEELQRALSESENTELLKSIEKEFEKLLLQNRKLIAENQSLTRKYSKAEDTVDKLKKAAKYDLPTDAGEKLRNKIYLEEISRLNKMLDILQASNLELRNKEKSLTEVVDKKLKDRYAFQEDKKSLDTLVENNRNLRAELSVISSRYKQLRQAIQKSTFESLLQENSNVSETVESLNRDLMIAQEDVIRQKALNSLMKLSLEKPRKEVLETVLKLFEEQNIEKRDK